MWRKNEATEHGRLCILTTRNPENHSFRFRVRKRLHRSPNPPASTSGVDTGSPAVLLWMGRILLMLSAVSLGTMPLTQHLWTWDRFLHGGQDFELGALAVLIFLSLILVLCRQSRQCLVSVFARWRHFELERTKHIGTERRRHPIIPGLDLELERGLSSGSFAFPIRI